MRQCGRRCGRKAFALHPTGSSLYDRASERLLTLGGRLGIKLRQTYVRANKNTASTAFAFRVRRKTRPM